MKKITFLLFTLLFSNYNSQTKFNCFKKNFCTDFNINENKYNCPQNINLQSIITISNDDSNIKLFENNQSINYVVKNKEYDKSENVIYFNVTDKLTNEKLKIYFYLNKRKIRFFMPNKSKYSVIEYSFNQAQQ